MHTTMHIALCISLRARRASIREFASVNVLD